MPRTPWPPPGYGPVIPIPEWAAEPVERVLRDLQLPRPVPVRISWTDDEEFPGILWLEELGDDGLSSTMSVGMYPVDPAQVAVDLADVLQEQLFLETDEAWAQPRPACPGHPHPAEPAVLDGEAWWTCPSSRERLSRIGEVPG